MFATSCGDNEHATASKNDPGETAVFHPFAGNPFSNYEATFWCDYNDDSLAQSFCHQEGYYKAVHYRCREIHHFVFDNQWNITQTFYYTIMDSVVCWRP